LQRYTGEEAYQWNDATSSFDLYLKTVPAQTWITTNVQGYAEKERKINIVNGGEIKWDWEYINCGQGNEPQKDISSTSSDENGFEKMDKPERLKMLKAIMFRDIPQKNTGNQ
jgi:hypothetical protein